MISLGGTKHGTEQAEGEGDKVLTSADTIFFFWQVLLKAYDYMNTLLRTSQGFGMSPCTAAYRLTFINFMIN